MFNKNLLAALLCAVSAQASLVFIGSPASLGANESIDWSVLGPPLTTVTSPFNVSTPRALGVQGSEAKGPFEIVQEGEEWGGVFNIGDSLLWTNGGGGPITFVFSSPIYGFGFQIQQDNFGAYTGSVQIFSGATLLNTFSASSVSSSAEDGSAAFLGALDTVAEITKIVVTDSEGSPNFAIDRLFLTDVPEPSSLSLVGVGLALAGALSLRARRSRRSPAVSSSFS